MWFLRAVLLPLPGMRHFVDHINVLVQQWEKVYRMHIAWLKDVVPEERLVVVDVKEGWEPLCRALGKEVPKDIPFPRINDAEAIDRTAKVYISRGMDMGICRNHMF
ncbi:hypothetical protein BO70DRAFT_395994 [Aspergillus heteromorphus CBS 117.55]|uniref:Uncharacterized protein n=1 Tax=Aspergillus heteromorphus CBS 117.55 TaxID=1448321 RepID=A0A317WCT0_9EURO|nr:uncharacterized protein BO70DRAFT_395994 [Aspergillus heteromorphus CBS 117.55]PWY83571.1 hypothetical protein BO70DRAFT_395994 [Aspergillus heteromorphus CBS 117.55]